MSTRICPSASSRLNRGGSSRNTLCNRPAAVPSGVGQGQCGTGQEPAGLMPSLAEMRPTRGATTGLRRSHASETCARLTPPA